MRSFEFVKDFDEKGFVPKLPEYQTKGAAAADFYCAEEVVIPSIWKQFLANIRLSVFPRGGGKIEMYKKKITEIVPTLVHTGIKSCMNEDEELVLCNRSSNPKKLGLILANGIGIVDSDYYENPDNDGEIMFAFYNLKPYDVTLKVGDRIGQGKFQKVLRPEVGLCIKDSDRVGGFGSTNEVK